MSLYLKLFIVKNGSSNFFTKLCSIIGPYRFHAPFSMRAGTSPHYFRIV